MSPGSGHFEELVVLRARVRAMRTVLEHMPGVLVGLYDVDGTCRLMEGARPNSVTGAEGRHYDEFVPAARRERFLWFFHRALAGETTKADYPAGEVLLECTSKPVRNERGDITHVFFFCRDITDERAAQHALVAKGGRDSLTGLARRTVLEAHMTGLLRKGDPFAVLFVDLDRFKDVNDTMGHDAGDVVLKRVAKELLACVRVGDLAVRIGGDEFVIVLANATCPRDIARRIRARLVAITEPFGAGASMGMARFPEDGDRVEALLKIADTKMYNAKIGIRDELAEVP